MARFVQSFWGKKRWNGCRPLGQQNTRKELCEECANCARICQKRKKAAQGDLLSLLIDLVFGAA